MLPVKGERETDDKVVRFLARILHAEREELGKLKARAVTIRHRLGRHRAVEKATNRLEDLEWAKPMGGYAFSQGKSITVILLTELKKIRT